MTTTGVGNQLMTSQPLQSPPKRALNKARIRHIKRAKTRAIASDILAQTPTNPPQTWGKPGQRTWEISCYQNKLHDLSEQCRTINESFDKIIAKTNATRDEKLAPINKEIAHYEALIQQRTQEFEDKVTEQLISSIEHINPEKEPSNTTQPANNFWNLFFSKDVKTT